MSKGSLVAAASLSAAALMLAGCGAPAPARHRSAAPAQLLSRANRSVLGTSFEAQVRASVRLEQTGVGGLSAATMQQLNQLRTDLGSSPLQANLEVQSRDQLAATYLWPPLLSEELRVIEVGGSAYGSLDGTNWHLLGPPAGASVALPIPGEFPNLATAVADLGAAAQGEVSVTDIGSESLQGTKVDHLRATVSPAGLSRILARLISRAGGSSAGRLYGLSQALQFGPAQLDTYLDSSSHLPVLQMVTASATLELGMLALLDPSQDPKATGQVSISLTLTVDYSHYGADFQIQKPQRVVTGLLPLPTPALSQFS